MSIAPCDEARERLRKARGFRPRLPPAGLTGHAAPAKGASRQTGDAMADDQNELLRELMAVFDELPAALREAINYAPEPLDPKGLATLCRRHGAVNVLAMIELKLQRRASPASPPAKPD